MVYVPVERLYAPMIACWWLGMVSYMHWWAGLGRAVEDPPGRHLPKILPRHLRLIANDGKLVE
jgi:hypothetical protein